ncbi:hypothetical protein NY08_556 [Rhodococcus sp. B7740]|uniref:hypothetical protein n=1 Tax=Rhodococcus sp. B7740 TaxID=1564114 RepID=UPI0005DA2BB7|nr:hypothetical protein [Rhodococcus sp. B7740]AJW38588.1 hypothetical protein NY08_556 [Rhodococcus sp. B7740]
MSAAVFTDEEGFEYTARRDGAMLVITRTDQPDISFAGRVEPLPAYEPVFVVPEPEPYAGMGPALDGQILEGRIVTESDPDAVLAIEAQEGSA